MEPERPDECCGFGGMFSMEEKEVSVKMGQDKLQRHIDTGAEYITGPDCSCLMHMQGIARNGKSPIRFIHVVEILASGLCEGKLYRISLRMFHKRSFKHRRYRPGPCDGSSGCKGCDSHCQIIFPERFLS